MLYEKSLLYGRSEGERTTTLEDTQSRRRMGIRIVLLVVLEPEHASCAALATVAAHDPEVRNELRAAAALAGRKHFRQRASSNPARTSHDLRYTS